MGWKEDVEVSLTVTGLFRVGSGRGGLEVDLPATRDPSNLSSSLRGVLRKSVRRMIHSANLSSLAGCEEKIFGSWVASEGSQPAEGKLRVASLSSEREKSRRQRRTGIRIDGVFGSVAHGALFTYEASEGERGSLTLKFKLGFNYPLDDEEAASLLAGLNGLLYDSIGSFASRGLGIVEKVDIDQKFQQYANQTLAKCFLGR
nr:RAMP superfamily CRISPR-associated protein [Candidatus Njordarchaeota archaeon]